MELILSVGILFRCSLNCTFPLLLLESQCSINTTPLSMGWAFGSVGHTFHFCHHVVVVNELLYLLPFFDLTSVFQVTDFILISSGACKDFFFNIPWIINIKFICCLGIIERMQFMHSCTVTVAKTAQLLSLQMFVILNPSIKFFIITVSWCLMKIILFW